MRERSEEFLLRGAVALGLTGLEEAKFSRRPLAGFYPYKFCFDR